MLIKEMPQPTARSGGYINNAMASAAIWAFYHANTDRVILKVFGFVKITVATLYPLFLLLAGPEA